jgi:hypothetical protein
VIPPQKQQKVDRQASILKAIVRRPLAAASQPAAAAAVEQAAAAPAAAAAAPDACSLLCG